LTDSGITSVVTVTAIVASFAFLPIFRNDQVRSFDQFRGIFAVTIDGALGLHIKYDGSSDKIVIKVIL
jgi:hypothetical protein